jgi:hypothetical protein
MKRVASILTTLALLSVSTLVLVSTTAAGPVASKERVVMEAKGSGPAGGTFVLTPRGPGSLKSDAGKYTFTAAKNEIVRSGQSVIVYTATVTLAGKRGTLVTRERIDDVAAGSGYRVGTGVWSPLTPRGTGQYAGLTGGGRVAYVLTPQSGPFPRWEGFVTRTS